MKSQRQSRVPRRELIACLLALSGASTAAAQSSSDPEVKHFTGLYLATALSSQNIFGGALINDIDVLAQDRGLVVVFAAGLRGQFLNDHVLVGVEFQYGRTSGDLTHFDPPSQSAVSYENTAQTGFGLTFGWVGGPGNKLAIFSYALSTERTFDIDIVDPVNTYSQIDGQRFLQYGLATEVNFSGSWSFRASVGRQYNDYGELVTNVDLERKPDLALGVVFGF